MNKLYETEAFFFLSEIMVRSVHDATGKPLGRIWDLAAKLTDPYPVVTHLLVTPRFSKKTISIPWKYVQETEQGYIIKEHAPEFDTFQPKLERNEILLKDVMLDKQIVDTDGAKIRRVNDLHFLRAYNNLYLVHVDVGFRGLTRRLGLERFVVNLMDAMFDYLLPDHLISWKYVQPVSSLDLLRLNIAQNRLSQLLPADLADILEDLNERQRTAMFNSLDVETAAETLEETDPKIQLRIIKGMDHANAADLLQEMSLSEAADLLGDLPREKAEGILQEMEQEIAEDVKELLVHDDEIAGGLMTTSFLAMQPSISVGEVLQQIRAEGEDLEFVYYVYIVDQLEHLLGMVSLRELLLAQEAQPISELMEPRVVSVNVKDEDDEIADTFIKYGLMAIPVVDDQQRIEGVILLKSLLELLENQIRR